MRVAMKFRGWSILVFGALCHSHLPSYVHAQGEKMTNEALTQPGLKTILFKARDELRLKKIEPKEIRLRLKVIEAVATVKAYFPHVLSGPPEYRNPQFWTTGTYGSFVPIDKPSEAIRDLWVTQSGVRCRKLSALVLIKALIEVSSEKEIAKLDSMLAGKVIPNDLPDDGVGTLFDEPEPMNSKFFRSDEFLPGDEIWFENPYFDRLDERVQQNYLGQEGHHVFYIGNDQVMDMYSREPIPIEEFRAMFLRWRTVKLAAEKDGLEPSAEDFRVKRIRRIRLDALK